MLKHLLKQIFKVVYQIDRKGMLPFLDKFYGKIWLVFLSEHKNALAHRGFILKTTENA